MRDSAGVTIVDNVPLDSAELSWWTIEGPRLDIGAAESDGPDALFRVSDAFRFPDGRIAIANSGSGEVRLFDAEGRHIASAGRFGEGPGELQAVGALVRGGADSILAYDPRARRVSVFTAEGAFARDFRLSIGTASGALVGRFADGSLAGQTPIFTAVEADRVESGVHRAALVSFRFSPDGETQDSLGAFPGDERYIRFSENSVNVLTLPFGRRSSFDVLGYALYVATQETPEYMVLSSDGVLRRIVRTGRTSEPITAEHAEAWIDRMVGSAPEPLRDGLRASYSDLPLPPTLPPYGALVVDPRGNVWLADADDPLRPSTAWSIYDADGELTARIHLPPGFRLFEAGDDFVLGLERDEMDVEHVRLYQLRKP